MRKKIASNLRQNGEIYGHLGLFAACIGVMWIALRPMFVI